VKGIEPQKRSAVVSLIRKVVAFKLAPFGFSPCSTRSCQLPSPGGGFISHRQCEGASQGALV
jgi:hypothetical protein